jgi:hypothetical protein
VNAVADRRTPALATAWPAPGAGDRTAGTLTAPAGPEVRQDKNKIPDPIFAMLGLAYNPDMDRHPTDVQPLSHRFSLTSLRIHHASMSGLSKQRRHVMCVERNQNQHPPIHLRAIQDSSWTLLLSMGCSFFMGMVSINE